MAAMFSQKSFGAHGDIMDASPEDDQGKAKLFEEIKNRARAEFGRKNLPQAEMLYSKGLKIKPEDATLHSNLAAVRLGLNKTQAALGNAEEAVRLDPSYAKGHYRKGQALMALSRAADAAEAFRAGAALEPESKLWAPLVVKAVKAAETVAVAPSGAVDVTASSSRTSAGVMKKTTPTTASSVRSSGSAAAGGGGGENVAKEGGEGGEGVVGGNGGAGGGGEGRGMKGYKKTADGRVTTYFNNDLTEEAKALIGDIAPKRLDAVGGGDAGEGAAGSDVSAWNKAGTWESRDMTSWAKQRLKELLLGVEFDAPEGVVEVVTVEKIEGDAETSFSRGKKRCLYDFRLELKWEASDLDCGPAKGMLVYPDVGQDCNGVYDVECRVDSSTPTAAKAYVDRHVRAEGSGLREAVLARLMTFTSELNAK